MVCDSLSVTLSRFTLRPGQPILDQLLLAARKAILSGEFSPGQPFPSIRSIAADLRIHPNTAHKAVQQLIQEGFLVARPGLGTLVGEPPGAGASERRRLLREEFERVVVDAIRVGLELPEVLEAIEGHWCRLSKHSEVTK
jgi:GntR family transcriptional regulator